MSSARHHLAAAYEGLEATFPDEASLRAYRTAMLARSTEQAELLTPLLDRGSVLEVGCGNGRLLIELARRGAIGKGLGLDIARSRIEFARRWADDEHLDRLRFDVADALDFEPPGAAYDAVVCITGAFAYFEPVAAGAAPTLLRRWATALRPGGCLVLELYPHPEIVQLIGVSTGILRLWRELEADDPWRYYLSEFRVEDGILIHDKTFIHRATGAVDAGRRERLMLYSEAQLRSLLEDAGLTDIVCRDGWADRPYRGGETMVVTARAAGRRCGS